MNEAPNSLPLYGLFFMQNGLNSCACIVQALNTLPTHQGSRSFKEKPTTAVIIQPAGNPVLWSRAGTSET